jgi:pimeloyl-ACP methyl ester carboxylesterase
VAAHARLGPIAPHRHAFARNTRRAAGLVAAAAAALLLLEAGAREAVALAVALAPNALAGEPPGGGAFAPPRELVARGVERFEVAVGAPSARLVSWLVEPTGAALGTIVLLHGVRSDRRSLVDMGNVLADAGYRSLLVDLRGHGESSGRYLTYGQLEAADVSSMLDAVEAREALGCVGAYGFSYGASVALELAARDARLKAVVAVAPFASLREVVLDYRERYLPFPLRLLPDAWFEQAVKQASELGSFDPDANAPVQLVSQSRAQQLLIHGTSDTQVPPRHSRELARAAGSRATVLPVDGASHHDLPFRLLAGAALGWYQRWLAQPDCVRP